MHKIKWQRSEQMKFPKKLFIIAASIVISTASVFADYETMNVFGGIGFGLGMGGTHYRANDNNEVKDHFYNYGSGLKLDLGCQYKLQDNLFLQGSFGYSLGVPAMKLVDATIGTTTTTTHQRHLFGIKLHLVPKFQVLDLLDMYAGVGAGFYWTSRSFKIVSELATVGKQEAEGKITSSPALGFSGLLGTDYPLNDKVTLFGELGFEQISFNLSKYKIDKSTIATQKAGSVYNYEKNATGTNNLEPEKVPGSNFQLRIGIRYAIK
jgi:opacity protein-like surface antigen